MKKWIGKVKDCDICDVSLRSEGYTFFADAATRNGPWALMCPKCWTAEGEPLGTGRGQLYDTGTRLKIAG